MSHFGAGYWSDHFRRVYVSHVRAFQKAVIERMLPAFAHLEDEAERIEDEVFEGLGHLPGDGSEDMDILAEIAHDVGLAYYEELTNVRQALLNICAAALFHLCEQQLLNYHRRQLLHPNEENDRKLFERRVIVARFAAGGINLEMLPSWGRLQELEFLANTVKHGAGRSADRLRERRPDLFFDPAFRGQHDVFEAVAGDVRLPLMGDDVYVTMDDFNKFADTVIDFWNELADAIARIG